MKKYNTPKRALAVIMAVSIILAACPVMSFAAKTSDGFTYTESNGEITITAYTVSTKQASSAPVTVVVPETINGKPVTKIGDGAFSNLSVLIKDGEEYTRKIILPKTIREIGFLAFGLSYISEININELENLEYIGAYAFMGTFISGDIVLPESVQYVGASAFTVTMISSLHLGKNVNIPQCEQSTTAIKNILRQSSVGGLVSSTLMETKESEKSLALCCENLKKITVDIRNPYYLSLNGVLYSKDMTKLYTYPSGKTDALFKIPATVDNFYNAFGGLYLNPVRVLNMTLDIMDGSFVTVNLSEYKYPSSLKTVVLSERITEICDIAFYNTGIQRIYIPQSVNTIGQKAFWHCTDLETVGFAKNSVFTTLPQECFKDCTSLKNVTFGCINYLDALAFGNCTSLASVDLTNVKSVSSTAFDGCTSLSEVVYQDTDSADKATVSAQSFDGQAALQTVMLGNSVFSVEAKAFADCANLTAAYISDEIENIDDTAFENCPNLTIVCPSEECYAYEYATSNNIPVTTLQIMPIPNQTYTGEEIEPELTVKASGRTLTENDYTAYYKDNVNAGLASVTVLGEGAYSVFASVGKFAIISRDINDGVEISKIPNMYVTGKEICPEITVAFNGKVLTENVDYIVEYADNIEAGVATAAVIGINNFTGVYTTEFNIIEATPGDANGDGIVDSSDYAIVRDYVACQGMLNEQQKNFADWNGDGVVDAVDVIAIDLILHKAL